METTLAMLTELRRGFSLTLQEARQMKPAPVIGKDWPEKGYFLPDLDQFMRVLSKQASARTLETIAGLSYEHR